ncbi:MAG: hypothetical protein R3D60_08810 [Paracoccaceae bacterium]
MTIFSKPLAALALAASLITAAPAFAGGQLAVSINASNPDEAQAIRAGLAFFALAQDIDANGHVTQNGINNAAGLYQSGPNNRGYIHQEGNNHTGTISQSGGNNAHGLFQFGDGTEGHVTQTGGEAGVTFLFGW